MKPFSSSINPLPDADFPVKPIQATPSAGDPKVPIRKPLKWTVFAVQTPFARATRHGTEPLRARLRFTPLRYAEHAI